MDRTTSQGLHACKMSCRRPLPGRGHERSADSFATVPTFAERGGLVKKSLSMTGFLIVMIGVLTSCAAPQIDRSDWIYVSRPAGPPPSATQGVCHRVIDGVIQVVSPAVNEPEMLWIRIPPSGGAKFLVGECASTVKSWLGTPEGKQALAKCLRGWQFPVEVETMHVEPARFRC